MAVDNGAQREALMERENALHDRLAEITRRITNARATLQRYEEQLQDTIVELTEVRQKLDELDKLLEGMWHGRLYSDDNRSRPSG
jgi:DNA repair exonuclease SbcCD ATPase subunit